MIPLLFAVSLFGQFDLMPATSPTEDDFERMPAPQTRVVPPREQPPVFRPPLRHRGLQGALITMSVGLALTGLSLVGGASCRFNGCTAPEVLFVTAAPVAIVAGVIAIVAGVRDPQ